MLRVASTVEEARALIRELPHPVGFVPTMGAIHAGHITLVARARAECASVVSSIFVNPLQFGTGEDFGRYPRTFQSDCAQLEASGVEFVFAPSVETMYPQGFATSIDVGPAAQSFEGELRPGHFTGVATVVLKLLNAVAPSVLYMGQKDAQQTVVVRRMIEDLDVPCALVVVDTVREPDGLALSSRNVYLSPAERAAAPQLYGALGLIADAVAAGETDREAVLARARALLALPMREAYLDVVDSLTFEPLDPLRGGSTAIGSAWLGTTRIIDNVPIGAGSRSTR